MFKTAEAFSLYNWMRSQPMAMDETAMINSIISLNSEKIVSEKIEAARRGNPAMISGAVAVLPLYGGINYKMDINTWLMGGTALNDWMKDFRTLVNDPNIGAIILDVDSPGGSVYGIDEASAEIYSLRGKKPIIAMCNPTMASAAYYIGSAADEIVATPTSQTGSVGVILLHEEYSKMIESDGVKFTAITYGKNKAEGNWWEPLSEDAKNYLQSQIDIYGKMFDKAVARNRNTNIDNVQSTFGQGRMMMAKDALKAGLIDRIATKEEVLKGLGVKNKKSNVSSEAESLDIQAEKCDFGLDSDQRKRELDMF